MRQLTIKMSLVCALMAILFTACEQDSILDNTLNSAENALQKASETTPNALANMVQQRRGAANAETVNVFQNSRTASTEAEVQKAVSEATVMDIQAAALAELRTSAPATIQLAIPTVKSKNFELDLVQVDLFY